MAVGEAGLCAITRTVYAEAAAVLAGYLAPQQVAVGVPGGLDILVHGVRAYLRAQPEHVVVRLDLRNAYNEIDRCVALRRLAAVPELAHLAPLFHALHAPMARLQLSTGRSLFDGVAGREGDSEEGVRQGSAESSAVFCVGIAPELATLDRELAAAGGAARGDADDVYACGPPRLVFEAVARFAESMERELGLVMRPEKLLCFSHNVDLAACPERAAHGVPVGILRDEAGEPLLVPCGPSGAPRQVMGITCGGVPIGEDDFEMEWMARRGASVAGYINSTTEQLRHLPGHLWTILFYCLQPRLDYWLRLLPVDVTRRAAQAVDAALLSTVEAAGRPGMLTEEDGTQKEGVILRRLRLPARRSGGGIRSRLELAPAAYCASVVESMERFLPTAGSTGFWAVLEPVIGAGAFAAGGHRLEQWLDTRSPESMSFFLAWLRCQAGVRDTDVRGPLDDEPHQAGVVSEGQLQHAITVQREQVEFQRLGALLDGLPDGDPARQAWLEAGPNSQTIITAWPSENTGVDLHFDDCLCHYLGGLLPCLVGEVGKEIPDHLLAEIAARPGAAADARRSRTCDGYGRQLETANLPGNHIAERSSAIVNVVAGDLPGASMETKGLFAHVLPQVVLNKPRESITPDITAHTRAGLRKPPAGAPKPPMRKAMMDVKTLSGANELYHVGPHARSVRRGAPVAERARQVNVDYIARARTLDHKHSKQPDGRPYPKPREQVRDHLTGPVLTALGGWDPVVGLVVGSYQGCSEALETLAHEAAEAMARSGWKQMVARSEDEALGIFMHSVRRRWGSVMWRSWARVIHGRLPAIGQQDGAILRHGPPPARGARGRVAVGGAEAWPQVHPGVVRGARAAAGL